MFYTSYSLISILCSCGSQRAYRMHTFHSPYTLARETASLSHPASVAAPALPPAVPGVSYVGADLVGSIVPTTHDNSLLHSAVVRNDRILTWSKVDVSADHVASRNDETPTLPPPSLASILHILTANGSMSDTLAFSPVHSFAFTPHDPGGNKTWRVNAGNTCHGPSPFLVHAPGPSSFILISFGNLPALLSSSPPPLRAALARARTCPSPLAKRLCSVPGPARSSMMRRGVASCIALDGIGLHTAACYTQGDFACAAHNAVEEE